MGIIVFPMQTMSRTSCWWMMWSSHLNSACLFCPLAVPGSADHWFESVHYDPLSVNTCSHGFYKSVKCPQPLLSIPTYDGCDMTEILYITVYKDGCDMTEIQYILVYKATPRIRHNCSRLWSSSCQWMVGVREYWAACSNAYQILISLLVHYIAYRFH